MGKEWHIILNTNQLRCKTLGSYGTGLWHATVPMSYYRMICRLPPAALLLASASLPLPLLLSSLPLPPAASSLTLPLLLAEAAPCEPSGGADRATTRSRCGCCCCAMWRGRTCGKAASGAAAAQGGRGPPCRSSASLHRRDGGRGAES